MTWRFLVWSFRVIPFAPGPAILLSLLADRAGIRPAGRTGVVGVSHRFLLGDRRLALPDVPREDVGAVHDTAALSYTTDNACAH